MLALLYGGWRLGVLRGVSVAFGATLLVVPIFVGAYPRYYPDCRIILGAVLVLEIILVMTRG